MAIRRGASKPADFREVATGRRLAPVHPGEVLLYDFIEPLGLSRYKVAKAMGVPQRRVDEVCAGMRAITADTALRLARVFATDAQIWLNLQAQYDLEVAQRAHGRAIEREATPLEAVA